MVDQLVSMELDYTNAEKIKALSVPEYEAIKDRFPEFDLPDLQENVQSYITWRVIGTIHDVQFLTDHGLNCRISRVRGLMDETLPKLGVPQPQGPQVVNITIPNIGLFAVKKLMVLENECTEYVDKWLSKGWRIVAVCPPNDCRRPTYILGSMEERDHG